MAIENCPECHREISSDAKTCPHCGKPIHKNQFWDVWTLLGSLGCLIILVVLGMLFIAVVFG